MNKWTELINGLQSDVSKLQNGKDFYPNSKSLIVNGLLEKAHMLKDWYSTNPQGDDRYKKILNMPKISLDLDEVLCDFLSSWKKRWNIKSVPTSWFFDRQILKRFDIMRESRELDEFYMNLQPLVDPKDILFEPCCYITSRPVSSQVSEDWLDKHGFPQRPVYTTDPDKGITKVSLCEANSVEVFVDDRFENWRDLNKAGITCYLYTQPHNERYDVGHLRINNLKQLV
jgi:hypothetical protein